MFSSSKRLDGLWGSPSLLLDECHEHREQSDWYVNLTTHLHVVAILRTRGAMPPHPHKFP
jgi:hypothetical protein